MIGKLQDDNWRCHICGARLTWAWVDGVRQVACCNALYDNCPPPEQLNFGKGSDDGTE